MWENLWLTMIFYIECGVFHLGGGSIIILYIRMCISLYYHLMILIASTEQIRLTMLFSFCIMLSFKDFQTLCKEPETMGQFVEVEFETKHLFGFIMETWYKGFYTSYSVIK